MLVIVRRLKTLRGLSPVERRQRIRVVVSIWRRQLGRAPLLALYALPALVVRMMNWRILPIHVTRHFGNLADLPAVYLRTGNVGLRPQFRRSVILASRRRVVNHALLDCWRPHFLILENRFLTWILSPLSWHPISTYDPSWTQIQITGENGARLKGGPALDEVIRLHEEKTGDLRVVEMDTELERRGREALIRLGMDRDAWWVSLHVREQVSLGETVATHRNADIGRYLPAVQRIVDRGGWVVRVGDPKMSHLPELPGVIDYVHSDEYADWMDVFLMARCRFMLATSSGPFLLPGIFGTPVACADWSPFSMGPMGSTDLYIPKLIRDINSQKFLPFRDILKTTLAHVHGDVMLAQNGLELVDSEPEEISDLVDEMLDRLDGTINYSESDEALKSDFLAGFDEYATIYSWGRASRFGKKFAAKYHRLISE